MTLPPSLGASIRAETWTASQRAVPDWELTERVRKALSASIVALEKPLCWTALFPKGTRAIRSDPGLEATNEAAAAAASASGFPAIDREVSRARTTFFERPRLTAWRPATG